MSQALRHGPGKTWNAVSVAGYAGGMRTLVLGLACLVVVACGDDGGGSPGTDAAAIDSPAVADAAIDSPPATFTLTSAAYLEGAAIPVAHTCDGANTSPALAWTDPPAGAMSFAIVFTDTTNTLIHSVIYDIPAATTMLPEAIQKVYAPGNVPGAHQTRSYQNAVFGYNGPCPPPADGAHTYELALYALGVATLPGATMNTNAMQARNLIEANDLAMTTLTGTADR